MRRYLLMVMVGLCFLSGCRYETMRKTKRSTDMSTHAKIILGFEGEQVEGVLENSKTAKDFVALLPLTLHMSRFYEREYSASLKDKSLSQEGDRMSSFKNGDITYYVPGNAIAIFFDKDNRSKQDGFIRIGKLSSHQEKFIKKNDHLEVTISLKEESKKMEYAFKNVVIEDYDSKKFNKEQKEVLYQYARYSEAMTKPDMETLNEMITNDSTFTHMSGRTQTKQEYLKDIESGRLNYRQVEIKNPVVTIEKDMAYVECTTVLTANAYGAKGAWPFRGTRTFKKINGTWKVINK